MKNKYTADDLAEALKYLENNITFEELDEFMDSLNLDVELVTANDALYELGAEKFLDEYNEYFKTLHVGDVYKNIIKSSICYNQKVIITEYDNSNGSYYVLYDDGEYIKITNASFNFDCYEKIGSIDTSTFVHSKNDLINKANEL